MVKNGKKRDQQKNIMASGALTTKGIQTKIIVFEGGGW